jgi:RNA polymerase sigma factor (TIGR02999 family)
MDPTVSAAGAGEITLLLKAWAGGDVSALDRLTPLVYGELRRQARRHMRQERAGHTLQGTALVNEAYLRLAEIAGIEWESRTHFFAVASRTMRRVLVDAARARLTGKRGGGFERVAHSTAADLDAIASRQSQRASQMCGLDDALEALTRIDPRRAQVVELRFFGGLTVEETAEVLNISPQSVMRDWRLARAWLTRELRG